MPTLKGLACHIQWAETNVPFKEYGTAYGDGVVETHIAIPDKPQCFNIRLTSNDFISEGLAAIVFVDGTYQCNRNRVNLVPHKKGLPKHRTEIDFLMRQKEKVIGDGTYMGRQWRFDDHNIVPDPPGNEKAGSHFELLGSIEVHVLRCRAKHSNGAKASDASSAADSIVLDSVRYKTEESNELSEVARAVQSPVGQITSASAEEASGMFGGLIGLFDGAADHPYYSVYNPYGFVDRYDYNYSERPHRRYYDHDYDYYARYGSPPRYHSPQPPQPPQPPPPSSAAPPSAAPPHRTGVPKRVHFDHAPLPTRPHPASVQSGYAPPPPPPPPPRRDWANGYSDYPSDYSDSHNSQHPNYTPGLSEYVRSEYYSGHPQCPRHYADWPRSHTQHQTAANVPHVLHSEIPPRPTTSPYRYGPYSTPAQQNPPFQAATPFPMPAYAHPVWSAPPSTWPGPPGTTADKQRKGSSNISPKTQPNPMQGGTYDDTAQSSDNQVGCAENTQNTNNDPVSNDWSRDSNDNNAQAWEDNGNANTNQCSDWETMGNTNANQSSDWQTMGNQEQASGGNCSTQVNSSQAWNSNQTSSQPQPGASTWDAPQATGVHQAISTAMADAPIYRAETKSLYGPHGAYHAIASPFDSDVPCDAEEEPCYDVPQSYANDTGSRKQVQPGKGYIYLKKRYAPQYIDTINRPYAKFVFLYRTKEELEKDTIARLDVEPSGNEEVQDFQDVSKDDLIQMLLRAKGALGGKIPSPPPPSQSKAGQAPQQGPPKPIAIDPPIVPYLNNYDIPPPRQSRDATGAIQPSESWNAQTDPATSTTNTGVTNPEAPAHGGWENDATPQCGW